MHTPHHTTPHHAPHVGRQNRFDARSIQRPSRCRQTAARQGRLSLNSCDKCKSYRSSWVISTVFYFITLRGHPFVFRLRLCLYLHPMHVFIFLTNTCTVQQFLISIVLFKPLFLLGMLSCLSIVQEMIHNTISLTSFS